MSSKRLTRYILIGLVLGILAGYIVYTLVPESSSARLRRARVALLPIAFLRLIKMIIAPLVFSTLVVGIAQDGRHRHRRARRRQGARLVHLRVAHLADAGPDTGAAVRARQGHAAADPGRRRGLGRAERTRCRCRASSSTLIPTSIVDAMARNEILQIVVFSLFFGIGHGGARRAQPSRSSKCSTSVAHIMLKVTGYVMLFAPLAVFGALAGIVAKQGLEHHRRLRHLHGRVLPRPADPVGHPDHARRRSSSARACCG